jgi:hypothetical protein
MPAARSDSAPCATSSVMAFERPMNRVLCSAGAVGVIAALLAMPGCGRKVIELGIPLLISSTDAGSAGVTLDSGQGDAAPPHNHPCTTNRDCTPFNKVCVTEKHQCGECTADTRETQCPRSRTGLRLQCEPATNLCVECLDDEDCPASTVCHPKSHFCTVPCTADNCFINGPGISLGVCEEGVCSICRDDSQCEALQALPFASLRPKCSNGACVECLTDRDCRGSRPQCNANGSCDL